MNEGQVAQGWYQDPYAIHEHRYFSAGLPTKLDRDGLQESYDPPPDGPLPDGELVPAVGSTEEAVVIRPSSQRSQSGCSAVFDYFDRLIKQ
jgi:hypothetical protein